MASLGQGARRGVLQRFFSRLRFPQIFALLVGLFVLDFFLLDPLPFVDEAIIALLALLLGLWKEREEPETVGKPPEKNITPAVHRPSLDD